MGTTRTPSGGTVTISGGTVGGSTVTITGCGSTVLTAGFGVLVETTTTLNTYTFHRLVPKATEVTTVAAISSDITTVAGDTTDIGVVSGLSSDIQSLADIEDGTVATDAISNVGNNISSVVTTASNISGVNSFADRYRVSSSAPTTSLDSGDLYFDTSTNILNVYGSSGWQNAGSSVNGTSQRYNYTATSGQTTFTGSDNNGNTLAYDAGFIDVYLNGVKLLNGTDVTVTSGSSIVLASGATTGDVVDIVAYGTFSVASLNASDLSSGTVPDARITGAYTGLTSLTITTADNSTGLELISTDADANVGPRLSLYRNSASPADNDILGDIRFMAEDDASAKLEFAKIEAKALDVSSGSRDTQLRFQIRHADSGNDILKLTPTEAVFNDGSFDTDFRVESNDNANMLFVDASANKVGIGTSSPDRELTVGGVSNARIGILSNDNSTGASQLQFGDPDNSQIGRIYYEHSDNSMRLHTNNTERMRIDSSGNVLINTTDSSTLTAGIKLRASDNAIAAVVTSNPSGYFGRLSTDGDIIKLRKDSTTVGSIGVVNSNNLYIQGDSTNSGLQCGTNTILPVQNGANASNTIDMGDGSNLWKDLYLGGGLYVGGTGTANKLDDYEEGTFTPIIKFGGGTTGISATQVGAYTKIGNLVTLQIFIEFSNKGSSTGAATISGIPFTIATLTNSWSGVGTAPLVWHNMTSSLVQAGVTVNRSSQFLTLFGHTASNGNGTNQALTNTDFANNSYIGITAAYLST